MADSERELDYNLDFNPLTPADVEVLPAGATYAFGPSQMDSNVSVLYSIPEELTGFVRAKPIEAIRPDRPRGWCEDKQRVCGDRAVGEQARDDLVKKAGATSVVACSSGFGSIGATRVIEHKLPSDEQARLDTLNILLGRYCGSSSACVIETALDTPQFRSLTNLLNQPHESASASNSTDQPTNQRQLIKE